MTDDTERWNDLRETWADLKNGRGTRSSELVSAWQESGLDLVTNSDPIPLPEDACVCLDAAMFASVISPDWLAGRDGTTSYIDIVFRGAERELWRQQRERALEEHASTEQQTLEAVTDGGSNEAPEPLNLEMLNGATLKWEDADGETHSVEFSDGQQAGGSE